MKTISITLLLLFVYINTSLATQYFYYDGDAGDDTLEMVYYVQLTPIFSGADSNILGAEIGDNLDSIGTHVVKIVYYEPQNNGDSSFTSGIWYHGADEADFKYGGGDDSVQAYLAPGDSTRLHEIYNIVYFWGACDSCYQRMYPEGGTANKDSVIIIDPSQGADSLVAKIEYIHGVTASVVDTAYFFLAPWW